MDWDLWGPPDYCTVEEQTSFGNQSEWQRTNHLDDLEADALNEKLCVKVLKILNANADSEIDELGRDLVQLQSELAWMENEEWSQLFLRTLTEKIKRLDGLVGKLRNADMNDAEVHRLMDKEPVESLHDILKDLLSVPLPSKEIQKPTQDTDEPSSIRMFNKEETRANGDFDTVDQGCIKESDDANKHSIGANKSKRIKTTKYTNVGAIKSTEGAAECGSGLPDDGNEPSISLDSMNSNKEEATQNRSLSAVDIVASDSSLIIASKTTDCIEKSNPAGSVFKNPSETVFTSSKILNESHYSGLCTSEESRNIDLEQKLCDFVPAAAHEKNSNKAKIPSSLEAQKLDPQDGGKIAAKDCSLEVTNHPPLKVELVGLLDYQMSGFDCSDSLQKEKAHNAVKFEPSSVKFEDTVYSASQCSDQVNLASLNMKELHVIAKQRKLARYYDLRKKELLELLAA